MSYPQETFSNVSLTPGTLVHKRRHAVASNTLLYQLEVLKKTGRYDAFKLQWHPIYDDAPNVWPVPAHLFWDSDIAKWIEGACYFLHEERHSKIEVAIQELCTMIKNAQQPDGYLNIHYIVVEPDKRFTNLRDMHELYNAGHLIEAALAHHNLYKNEDLLGPIMRYVDLLCRTFGPESGQIHGYPGHPEIELALLRLYQRTQKPDYLALAQYFLRERGNPKGVDGKQFYEVEAEKRGDDPYKRPRHWPDFNCQWYNQAHKPLVEQESIEGHSVRAMYLLTAAADLCLRDNGDISRLLPAVRRLWDNMVNKKMYLTGGIGAMKQWEGFGLEYFLPQGDNEGGCYAETCAAIGVMMLAERLLQIELNGSIGDVMELCLYNAVLTAMSHDGTKFTYVNQLASSDQNPALRAEWFTCACCPPNIMRLLGQIGGYIYSQSRGSSTDSPAINVHLFISSVGRFEVDGQSVTIEQWSNWPWSGEVRFQVKGSSNYIGINLRIPAWAEDWTITPSHPRVSVEKGYLRLSGEWVAANPEFTLAIPIRPRLISSHPFTRQDIVALARGPIVYCVEDFDNPWVQDHFESMQLDPACSISQSDVVDDKTGDSYVALTAKQGASLVELDEQAFSPSISTAALTSSLRGGKLIDELHFVPYFFRSNRGGRGHSRVGLRCWIR